MARTKETPEQKAAKAAIKENPLETTLKAIKELTYSQLLKVEEEIIKAKDSLKEKEKKRLEKEIQTLTNRLKELDK